MTRTMTDVPPALIRCSSLCIVAGALILGACAPVSRPIARVGPRTITAADLLDYAKTARSQYSWMPDSAKRMLLDDLIRRDLLLLEAHARGVSQDTMLSHVRRAAEEEQLLTALTDQLAPRDVPVSEAEVATLYDWHKLEHHLQVIHATDAFTAGQALARLRAGQPFGMVAAAFNTSGMVPPDGDLGWVPGGAMVEPLDSSIRAARTGQIVGPLQAGDNWFIARVLERRAAKLPPLAVVRQDLASQVGQRKHRATIQRIIEMLHDEYRLRLEPGGGQELFMRANLPAGEGSALVRPGDAAIVLARYDTPAGPGSFTMADALLDLQGDTERPTFTSLPSIQRWIESRVVRRLVLIEARRRHLQEQPDIARRVTDRVDAVVLQSIFESQIANRIQVTEDDLKAEYLRRVQGGNAPPYDSVPPPVKEQLRQLTIETRRDAVLRDYTDQLKRKYPVTIDKAALDRVQLPVTEAPEPLIPQG